MDRLKLLVFGARGQLARAIAERAAAFDASVTCVGRQEADIAQSHAVEDAIAASDADVVINTAAFTAVDAAESDHEAAQAVNRDGPANIASACRRAGRPLVHISTDFVFDGSKGASYVEDDPVSPLGVYGLTKLDGERAVREAHEHSVILRSAWVYSPFEKNFLMTMLRLAAERDQLTVVDDQRGNPTAALDFADACLAVAGRISRDAAFSGWGIYHSVGAGEATWCELARQTLAYSAEQGGPTAEVSPISSKDWPTAARRPADSRLDTARFQETFGLAMPEWRVSLSSCVKRILEEMGY